MTITTLVVLLAWVIAALAAAWSLIHLIQEHKEIRAVLVAAMLYLIGAAGYVLWWITTTYKAI